jgi:hypothetical protein
MTILDVAVIGGGQAGRPPATPSPPPGSIHARQVVVATLYVPKIHPGSSGGVVVLVEDAAELIMSDIEVVDSVRFGDRLGGGRSGAAECRARWGRCSL